MKVLTFLILSFASATFADDFKTIDGKEYKNVTVTNQEADGITVTNMKAGLIAKLPFAKLPKDVQERFGYDPDKAAAYSAQQNAGGVQLQNIHDLEPRQTSLQNQEYALLQEIGQAEEAKKHQWHGAENRLSKMDLLAAQLPALKKHLDEVRAQKDDVKRQLDKAHQPQPQNNVEALNAHYSELLRKEDDLMRQIAEGEVGQYRAIPNPEQHAELPSLHGQLDEVRREKDQVRKQLEQAQR